MNQLLENSLRIYDVTLSNIIFNLRSFSIDESTLYLIGLHGVMTISAMLKVPDGTFSWKWLKSLAQRSDLNLVGSTWSPKYLNFINTCNLYVECSSVS